MEPVSPALAGEIFTAEPPGKPLKILSMLKSPYWEWKADMERNYFKKSVVGFMWYKFGWYLLYLLVIFTHCVYFWLSYNYLKWN